MEKRYTVEKAAYLLGVDEERLQELIDQNLVETESEDDGPRVPKREIARLYPWMAEGDDLDQAPREPAPAETDGLDLVHQGEESDSNAAMDPAGLRVEDEELLRIYGEMKQYQTRIQNLGEKVRRLASRINRLQTIGAGESAKFWERASALYPEIDSNASMLIEEMNDGSLVLKPRGEEDSEDYKERLQRLVAEGIEKGHLPPGFLGVFPRHGGGPEEGEDDAE